MSGAETSISFLPVLFVIVGGPILIWWLKRHRPRAFGSMRIVERTALTKSAVVSVVEVDGHRFLIGATDQGISLLSELGAAPAENTLPPSETPRTESGHHGPRTSPLERMRAMTTRVPTRPRPPRVRQP